MRKVIIACGVLRREVEYLLEKHGLDMETVYLESQLHNSPEQLRSTLQSTIDSVGEADKVYLVYSKCGNGLNGLVNGDFELVYFGFEDCIHLLMEENPNYGEMRRRSYFSTAGWILGEEGLGYYYDEIKEKRGEERALRIIRRMYANYEYLYYIATPAEDTVETENKVRYKAEKFGLEYRKTTGGLSHLEKMLLDEESPYIRRIEKKEKIIY